MMHRSGGQLSLQECHNRPFLVQDAIDFRVPGREFILWESKSEWPCVDFPAQNDFGFFGGAFGEHFIEC